MQRHNPLRAQGLVETALCLFPMLLRLDTFLAPRWRGADGTAAAIGPKATRVRTEGKVIHCGKQLATAEARLYGPDGTLYAHATTTCLVFEMPTAKTEH